VRGVTGRQKLLLHAAGVCFLSGGCLAESNVMYEDEPLFVYTIVCCFGPRLVAVGLVNDFELFFLDQCRSFLLSRNHYLTTEDRFT
jgi:hypothetical protein